MIQLAHQLLLTTITRLANGGTWVAITAAELADQQEITGYDEHDGLLEICTDDETFLLVRYLEPVDDDQSEPSLHVDAFWWDAPEDGGALNQRSLTLQYWHDVDGIGGER